MKVHQLLTPRNWLKHQIACDKHGDIVIHPDSPMACGWCLVGAIEKVYGPACHSQILAVAQKIQFFADTPVEIVADWNDDPKRTFEEVHRLLVALDL